MNNDFDKLSLDNTEITPETSVSVIEPKCAPVEPKRPKPTIFAAIYASMKQDSAALFPAKGAVLPNLKNTFYSIIAVLVISCMMVILQLFVNKTVLIPIAVQFFATIVPLPILVFFWEFNTTKSVKPARVFVLFMLGGLLYVIVSYLSDNLLSKMFYNSLVDSVVLPIFINILVFVVIFLFASFFKAKSISDCFLIGVAIAVGYGCFENLISCFNNLFIPTQLDGSDSYYVQIILNNNESLTKSFDSLLGNWFGDFFLKPYLYSSWSMINAFLVSLLIDSRRTRINMPRSMYLLILLVIILNVLAVIDTSFLAFNFILRVISLVATTYVSIRFLNSSLAEEQSRLQ